MPLHFDNTYARLPAPFFARVNPTAVSSPAWLAVNPELGALLGLTADELPSPELLAVLAGNAVAPGSEPIALAYAGHQFGNFVPRLGDGRAILLGEVVGTDGVRRDVQLKGSGPTPFSRGGDGRAAIGPVLREFLVSEAMHALGVPTTRSLAAVATGERVYREDVLPGAVLTRIATSHLRVGTFQYFAARQDRDALDALVRYAIARHHPQLAESPTPALSLFDAVCDAQRALVARWLSVGFVHGVMNTDNCAISGETIDYGPCAFLDAYEPARHFSSIDRNGRYAWSQQPRIVRWNLARLAETLIPLLGDDDASTVKMLEARLGTFAERFEETWSATLRAKFGLVDAQEGDAALAQEFLAQMAADHADFTQTFRALTHMAAGADDGVRAHFTDRARITTWLAAWRTRLEREPSDRDVIVARMRRANPAIIPRNHRVEEALSAAQRGDLGPFERLRAALARPFDDDAASADLTTPPGEEQWGYRTFCGT